MGSNREVESYNHLVLFDGVCVFCNTSVDFILNNERSEHLLFVPLQSDLGKSILEKYHYPSDYIQSILFLKDGHLLNKSSAALAISAYLKRPTSWMRFFRFVPAFIRDFVYGIIANNRYRWFGKYDACRLPTPDLRKRFLE